MRVIGRFALFALASLLIVFAADLHYQGTWSSDSSAAAGKIDLQLKPGASVSFTMDSGESVRCKVVSAKVDTPALEVQYDFELQGYKLRSTLNGTITGETVEGKYTTKSIEDGSVADSGTFKATAAKQAAAKGRAEYQAAGCARRSTY